MTVRQSTDSKCNRKIVKLLYWSADLILGTPFYVWVIGYEVSVIVHAVQCAADKGQSELSSGIYSARDWASVRFLHMLWGVVCMILLY